MVPGTSGGKNTIEVMIYDNDDDHNDDNEDDNDDVDNDDPDVNIMPAFNLTASIIVKIFSFFGPESKSEEYRIP